MVERSKPSEESGEGKDLLRVAFGDVLREYRKKMDSRPTQAQLSALAQLPSSAVGDLERGERTIKGPELKSICNVLGIRVRDFLARVMKEQLRAMGEPEGEEPEEAAPAKAPDLFLTLPLTGGSPDAVIQLLREWIKRHPFPEGRE